MVEFLELIKSLPLTEKMILLGIIVVVETIGFLIGIELKLWYMCNNEKAWIAHKKRHVKKIDRLRRTIKDKDWQKNYQRNYHRHVEKVRQEVS